METEGHDVASAQFADRFYDLYDYLFDEDSEFVDTVDKKLGEASRDIPRELFLSRAVGYGTITGLSLWALSTLLVVLIFVGLGVEVGDITNIRFPNETMANVAEMLRVPLLIITTGLIFGTMGAVGGFFAPVINLYMQSNSRQREINRLLPDSVAFMYALSIGGMNQLDILESVAKADDTYGEVSKEFEIILQETRYFGVDYRTAIRNRALESPSDEFGQFLTDMLSILSSGGDMTSFLEDQREKFHRNASQQQERVLETLELFGEMFMTVSLFPLLLIILLVIMKMIGSGNQLMLYLAVYGLIPLIGGGFIVLISTIKQDETGDGYLVPDENDPYIEGHQESALGIGVIEQFESDYSLLATVENAEGTHQAMQILKAPHSFLMDHPQYTFLLTGPATLVLLAYSIMGGIVKLDWKWMQSHVVWSTFVLIYIPLYLNTVPYTIAYEVKERRRGAITDKLSDNLRKLASANDTGQTLLESFKTVAETSGGRLANEFEEIHNKVKYGISMKQALIEFNNKYHLPRLARTIKLIGKAQETSSQITPVLKTAALAAEQEDKLAEERKNRSRMQVVIIIMTYITLLAVMVLLKVKFLGPMAEMVKQAGAGTGGSSVSGSGGVAGGFSGINVGLLSLMFFHAVTLQAVSASLISGYLRAGKLQAGMKYLVILPTIALIAWIFV